MGEDRKILEVVLDIQDKLTPGLKRAAIESGSAAKKVAAQWRQVGEGMKRLGSSLTRNLTLPIIALGAAALRSSMQFNKAMANVATLIPGNIERVRELKLSVQELSVEMGVASSDVSAGLYEVISAFGDTTDTVEKLRLSVMGGVAGLASTKEALDLAAIAMKGYGDETAKGMRKTLDLAFATVRMGKTSFPELAGSMGQVIATSAALGISQEELFAVYSSLTGATGNARRVTTQYQATLTALTRASPAMEKAMRQIGFETVEAMIKALGYQKALKALVETTDGTQAAILELFVSVEAMPAVLALSGAQAAEFTSELAEMYLATGDLKIAFREQTQGIDKAGFQWRQFREELSVVAQNLGDSLMPALVDVLDAIKPIIDFIKKMAKAFKDSDPAAQQFLLVVGGIAALAGPVITFAGSVITLATGIGTLTAAMAANNAVAVTFLATMRFLSLGGMVLAVAFLPGDVPSLGPVAEARQREVKRKRGIITTGPFPPGGEPSGELAFKGIEAEFLIPIGTAVGDLVYEFDKAGYDIRLLSDAYAGLYSVEKTAALAFLRILQSVPTDVELAADIVKTRGKPLPVFITNESGKGTSFAVPRAFAEKILNLGDRQVELLEEFLAGGGSAAGQIWGTPGFVEGEPVAPPQLDTSKGFFAGLKKAFGRNENLMDLGAAALQGGVQGGVRGTIASVLPIIGNIIAPGAGGLLGALVGGFLGKPKKPRGETSSNPLFTFDVRANDLLTKILIGTKLSRLRAAGAPASGAQALAREASLVGVQV